MKEKPTDNSGPSESAREVAVQTIGRIEQIDPATWDALNAQAHGGSLTSHAMLQAFEESASVCPTTGWQPHHLLLEFDGKPFAAIPMYAKGHSYGEFVFDWAWADAYERHGQRYYPKWLSGVPFTPATGPRLLCHASVRDLAAQALIAWAKAGPLSSLHILHTSQAEQVSLIRAGFLARKHTQFHWFNQNWQNFEEFLASLSQSKRKKIRAERRKVREAGITTRVLEGAEITSEQWDFFYGCYASTYAMRGNPPYLTRDFFERVAHFLPECCLMVIAYDGERAIASALSWLDRMAPQPTLYGRYWGCTEHVDCLHFEVAYYSTIEWAIDNQIAVFEGGAQGQHKMARGFMPVQTQSAHWLAHPGFFEAVQDYVKQESQQLDEYTANLRSPFRNEHGESSE